MIIDLGSIGTTAKKVGAVIAADDIELEDEGRLLGNASFDGTAFREANKVHLRGEINADVEVACSRCLELVKKHLAISFEDVFVDASDELTNEETELTETDLDESLVLGGSIDLAEVVREQIVLEFPETVLCKGDCKGLCPQCGENRNLIDCNCDKDEIDPRWAVLKDLNIN